jgi:beta-phosphoglucomutase family hydrolase
LGVVFLPFALLGGTLVVAGAMSANWYLPASGMTVAVAWPRDIFVMRLISLGRATPALRRYRSLTQLTGRRRSGARILRSQMLGLPSLIQACLFDLDGVLTQTAKVHAAAWKEMFDAFLRTRSERTGEPFVPFDAVEDYDQYVDGKPRYDGVRSFLASRGIVLAEGDPSDPRVAETVAVLGNRKNDLVLALIRRDGVKAYDGSVRYVRAVRDAGLRRAVVSSSANCREVLAAAGIEDLFEVRIDGIVARREHLKGKPAPDTFLAAARELGVAPARAAVFEDALAGVAAGRAGGFGFVVGVDRVGQADALHEDGADIVVSDLAELLDR